MYRPASTRRENQAVAARQIARFRENRQRAITQWNAMLDAGLHSARRNAPLAGVHVDLIPGRAARLARPRGRQDQKFETERGG